MSMPAKYPGTCRDCRERFPKGTMIEYHRNGPRGRKTSHVDCANTVMAAPEVPEGAWGHGPGCYGECDNLYDCTAPATSTVSSVFRTSGGEFYRNRAGRCEDAPCCGCCTI